MTIDLITEPPFYLVRVFIHNLYVIPMDFGFAACGVDRRAD
jgi:hypothetical protein